MFMIHSLLIKIKVNVVRIKAIFRIRFFSTVNAVRVAEVPIVMIAMMNTLPT